MNWKTKIVIASLIIGFAATVGIRELGRSCAASPAKADAHGHAHENSEKHAEEGIGTKICEAGFVTAMFGSSGAAEIAARAEPAAGKESADAHGHKDEAKEKKGEEGHNHAEGAGHDEGGEGFVKLSGAQIQAAGIEMEPAASGKLIKEISVPGRIEVNANAQAKIVPKLSGTASEIKKQLGETVAKGEVLATLESREMADAIADYLASWRAEELAQSVFVREERLWKQKVTAEQDYLTAKNTQQSAKIKVDLAHQKLHAIGFNDEDIVALPKLKDEHNFRLYEIRSPIAGRVTARDLVLGQVVGTDREIFTIADLSTVWVEMAIAPQDLAYAKEGQEVRIEVGAQTGTGKVVALSPVIDPETRSAKAIAELDNSSGNWKLGDYANARLFSGEHEADILVPRGAIQTVASNKVVFVSEGGGFRMKQVKTGREDSRRVEIVSGLEFGETVATTNTFTLKAEIGKSEAEHEH